LPICLMAMHWIVQGKNDVPALGLERRIGVSDPTTWAAVHNVRKVMRLRRAVSSAKRGPWT